MKYPNFESSSSSSAAQPERCFKFTGAAKNQLSNLIFRKISICSERVCGAGFNPLEILINTAPNPSLTYTARSKLSQTPKILWKSNCCFVWASIGSRILSLLIVFFFFSFFFWSYLHSLISACALIIIARLWKNLVVVRWDWSFTERKTLKFQLNEIVPLGGIQISAVITNIDFSWQFRSLVNAAIARFIRQVIDLQVQNRNTWIFISAALKQQVTIESTAQLNRLVKVVLRNAQNHRLSASVCVSLIISCFSHFISFVECLRRARLRVCKCLVASK